MSETREVTREVSPQDSLLLSLADRVMALDAHAATKSQARAERAVARKRRELEVLEEELARAKALTDRTIQVATARRDAATTSVLERLKIGKRPSEVTFSTKEENGHVVYVSVTFKETVLSKAEADEIGKDLAAKGEAKKNGAAIAAK